MGRVVLMLEELSMKELLNGLLPRIFPGQEFVYIVHEGKTDLEKSIPRKLRAWRNPKDYFVIVRDNDRTDCIALKDQLRGLCQGTGHPETLVRIVCQELEAWYLAQPDALAVAFDDESLRRIGNRPRFRDPDARLNPSADLKRLCPTYQKVSGSRKMANFLYNK